MAAVYQRKPAYGQPASDRPLGGFRPIWASPTRGYVGRMNTRTVTDRVQDWKERATETARNVGQATDDYVRENTWTTLAMAALLGCIVGFLLSNRGGD